MESRVSGVVAAPIGQVWNIVRDFGNLSYFPPAIAVTVQPTSSSSLIGAIRTIALVGGGQCQETLLDLSDDDHTLSYRFHDDPALPFADYVARVRLIPVTLDDHTLVEWRARYALCVADPDAVRTAIEDGVMAACIMGLRRLLGGP